MNEIQNNNVPKAENTVNASPVDVVQPAAGEAAPPSVKTVVEALREIGTTWAETALGYGRVALENVAHAIERTAEKLGELQDKLKKGEAAAAAAR
jgi:hypothetical protein